MKNINNHKNVEQFATQFLNNFFVNKDIDFIRDSITGNFSMIGSGNERTTENAADTLAAFKKYFEMWKISYTLDRINLIIKEITPMTFSVLGEFDLLDSDKKCADNPTVKVSAFVLLNDAQMKFVQMHLSKPLVLTTNKGDSQVAFSGFLDTKLRELESLTNNIHGGILQCDIDEGYTIKYASEGFLSMLQYNPYERDLIIGKKTSNFIYPADWERVNAEAQDRIEQGKAYSIEYRLVTRENKPLWVLEKGSVFVGDNGHKILQAIVVDISRQKAQEQSIKLSEMRYEIAMSLTQITMFEYIVSSKEKTVYTPSVSSNDHSAYAKVQAEHDVIMGNVLDSSLQAYNDFFDKVDKGAPSAKCFVMGLGENGVKHSFELTLTTVYSEDGSPFKAIGVCRDIGERSKMQRESEFARATSRDRELFCEANLSKNEISFLRENLDLGIKASSPLTYEMFSAIMPRTHTAEEFQKNVIELISPAALIKKYEDGYLLSAISIPFKTSSDDRNPLWTEISVAVIKDDMGDYMARIYLRDIDEERKAEQKTKEHRRFYETMLANKSVLAYEVNLTKNKLISGHEQWRTLFNFDPNMKYSDLIGLFTEKLVHPDDKDSFRTITSVQSLVNAYESGSRQFSSQYRRIAQNGEYRWLNGNANLYEHHVSGDICAFAYVEDIDSQKRQEIALRFEAEHDKMTTLYNKSATEQIISSYLWKLEAQKKVQALFVIDVDNFKAINDNFGHLYGDQVLVDVSDAIKSSFRTNDIVGRIGGDEFCVLMKNNYSRDKVVEKANEVAEKLERTYEKDGIKVTISSSIGIAFTEGELVSYTELLERADQALYTAKRSGKNQIVVY